MQRIHDIQFQCITEQLECILLSDSFTITLKVYISLFCLSFFFHLSIIFVETPACSVQYHEWVGAVVTDDILEDIR